MQPTEIKIILSVQVFSNLLLFKTRLYVQYSHLIVQLTFNFGILFSLFTFTTILSSTFYIITRKWDILRK